MAWEQTSFIRQPFIKPHCRDFQSTTRPASGVSWRHDRRRLSELPRCRLSLHWHRLGTPRFLSGRTSACPPRRSDTAAILWADLMQVNDSHGRLLAGRYARKWANIHTDEVYFRDTAHGFLAWALAGYHRPLSRHPQRRRWWVPRRHPLQERGAAVSGLEQRAVDSNEYFVDSLFAR